MVFFPIVSFPLHLGNPVNRFWSACLISDCLLMLRSSGSSGIEPVVVSWTNFHYTTARFYQSEVLGGLRAVLASMDVRGVGLQLRLDVVPCLSPDLRGCKG